MDQVLESVEFSNSKIWLKYSHEKYLTLNDIKIREKITSPPEWKDLKNRILNLRKVQGINFKLRSLEKTFFYFQSDSLEKKLHQIEQKGAILSTLIKKEFFREQLLFDSIAEEGISSALYEGANTTRVEAKYIVANNEIPKNRDQWMVFNNYQTLNWIQKNKNRQIDLELIQELHAKITTNTFSDQDLKYIGIFRDHPIKVGGHKGVDEDLLEISLKEVIHIITNNPRYIHPLVKGILLHYFLAYIHPFTDGNGRTGRSLIYFQAIKEDLDFIQFLSLSAQFKFTGKRYIKTFELVLKNGLDLTYFVDFCLDSFLQALERINTKVDFLLSIKELKKTMNLNENQINLIQFLATYKQFRIATLDYAKIIGKTREMARKDLKDLLNKDLVKENKKEKKLIYSINYKILLEKLRQFV